MSGRMLPGSRNLSGDDTEKPATPGTALAWLRQSTALTIDETARRAGVSPDFLTRVEAGEAAANPVWLGAVATVLAEALSGPLREGGAR